MSRFAELRALVQARREEKLAAEQTAIQAELAKRPLAANEEIFNGLRMIPLEDALVRAEREEPDNLPLLEALRDLWARALKTRTVRYQWVAYENIRDAWRRHLERAEDDEMWD